MANDERPNTLGDVQSPPTDGMLMKILWRCVRDPLNPASGGAGRTIAEIGSRLCAAGHEVIVLSGGWRGARRHERLGKIEILRYGRNLLPYFASLVRRDLLDSADVIVDDLAHLVPWTSQWYTDTPVTVFFHHLHQRTLPGQVSLPLRAPLSFVESEYGRLYSNLPFVTESFSSFRDLVNLGVSASRIERIPPGVDSDTWAPKALTPKPTLIYFGGIRPYKRPSDALSALALIRRKGIDVSLIVVGSGPELPTLHKTAKRLGIDNAVRFTGFLGLAELSRLVASCWVNVYCSVAEGWGFSVMEAAAAGVPTAAYRSPGLTEAVQNGKTGFLTTPGSISELAEAIMNIIERGSTTYSADCRQWALMYDWNRTTASWIRHFQTITGIEKETQLSNG